MNGREREREGEQEVTRNHEERKSRGFRRRSRFRITYREKDSDSLLPNIGETIFFPNIPKRVRWKIPFLNAICIFVPEKSTEIYPLANLFFARVIRLKRF